MRRTVAALIALLLPAVAVAQPSPTFKTLTVTGGGTIGGTFAGSPIFSGAVTNSGSLSLTGAGTALSVTNNATIGGVGTFGSGSQNILTITPGATTANTTIIGAAGNIGLFPPSVTGSVINLGSGTGALGVVAAADFLTGGNANDGSTGNKFLVNNILQSQFYRTPGSTYTIAGTGFAKYVLSLSANFNGAYSGTIDAPYKVSIPTDTVAGGVLAGFGVFHNFGGTGFSGSRNSLLVQTSQTGDVASGASISGSASWVFVNNFSNTNALYYGSNPQVNVAANVTGLYGVFGGGEDNIKVKTGSTLNYKAVRTLINESGDAVQGALYDTALGISSQNNSAAGGTTVGWLNGATLGRPDGQWPLDAAGAAIGEYRQVNNASDNTIFFKRMVAACGMCMPDPQFTSFSLQFPAFSVSGTGVTSIGALTVTPNATGATIDATKNQLTASSVAVGGTGYLQGEDVYDANGNSWTLTTVAAGVVSGITLRNTGYGTATSATFATTNGHGTGLTIAETWTAPTVVQLGGASTNVLVGAGSALATNATAGFVQLATMAGAPTGTVGAAGKAAVVIDTTNKKICYSTGSGTWECSAAFTP